MEKVQPNNPLHGISLSSMLEQLVERHGWESLGARIRIRCFTDNPSVASSLKFLRKTEWARQKVEQLYLEDLQKMERNRVRNQRRAAMRAVRAGHEAAAAARPADPDEE
jgi:uncharacterized protein (DUF2132 family)